MTEKEIVQFFINQNNQIMGWVISDTLPVKKTVKSHKAFIP